MNEKFKNHYAGLTIATLAFLVIATSVYVSAYAKSVAPSRTFTVSGEGKVTAVPDIVELSFGVLTEGGKNLAGLTKENNDKVNLIVASLKKNGIAENDIVTQFYNITPRYQYFSCNPPVAGNAVPCPPAEIVGYSVSQNVFVKIREVGKAGDIVSGVVGQGANTISGLTFTIDDPAKLQNQAREKAIAKAKETAETIAASGGFRLGRLISAQEGLSSSAVQAGQPVFIGDKGGIGGGGAAIEPGTQDIKATMTLTYEIK